MRKHIPYLRVCPLIVVLFCSLLFLPSPGDFTKLSAKERRDYLRRARVWRKTNVASANLLLGPHTSINAPPNSEVACHYLEESMDVGATPKFLCRLLDTGEVVRVKYSRRETFAEIAGTRLLWALGFYTDASYPVTLRCYGCPMLDPSDPEKKQKRIERIFPDAIIEKNFPGTELSQFPDQGWRWDELRYVEARAGGATLAELDALKLIAVFLQHSDSKPPQQRLACFEQNLHWIAGEQVCKQPILMIQDLGATFGIGYTTVGAFSAMFYKGWHRTPIWNREKEGLVYSRTGRKTCIGRLTSAFENGLNDPEISEEGRAFLASLLNRLSDRQIQDLFRASRIDRIQEKIVEDSHEATVTVDHWVAAFKKKRKEISDRRCF